MSSKYKNSNILSGCIVNRGLNFLPKLRLRFWRRLKALAQSEGRKLHAVLDEAFQDYLQKKSKAEPRREVMQALASGMQEFDALYEALAK